MMRVLEVAHAFPPTFGGVETHLWDLSHRLAERGYEVCCLVGGEPGLERIGRIEVIRKPELRVEHLVRERRGLQDNEINGRLLESLSKITRETLQAFGPDIVHLHNAHHFAPELALSFFQAGARSALLNSVHDRVGEHLFPSVLSFPWSYTLFASEYLHRSLPGTEGPTAVLHLGIDLKQFSSTGEVDRRISALQRPVVFHPARLLRWKGVEIGLEAFLLLRRELSQGSLVLCDSANIVDNQQDIQDLRRSLEARARSAGLAKFVHFLGFDRSQMPGAYRASDLVWYPTIDEEPLGLAPLEAMACGVPLIVSDSGGMRETVLPDKTGLVVPKQDARALATTAKLLLSQPDLRKELVEAGERRAREFDIEPYTTEIEKIYASCLEGRDHAGA